MLKEIIATILSFLVIDIVWIQLVVNKLYKANLPSQILSPSPSLIPAIIFYLVFCLSLWFLIIKEYSGDLKESLIKAFVFGIATYATYALTNLSIVEGWDTKVAIGDTLWGGFLAVFVTFIVIWLKGL